MPKHLVFYDGQCGLCDRIVEFILHHDKKKLFIFAPLRGTSAQKWLKDLPEEKKSIDSLVLIENYQAPLPTFQLLGKGALRICWLLGGIWKIPGALSWLPPIFYDWGYRLIAKYRHRLWPSRTCTLPTQEERNRFLP